MYIEETIHKLSVEEMQILQSLVGRTIDCIKSADIEFSTNKQTYIITNPINISYEGTLGYITIEYEFSETYYGDDFYTPKITKQIEPIGISTSNQLEFRGKFYDAPSLVHTSPFAHLNFRPEFTVNKIEIYGIESVLEARSIIFGPDTNYLERIEKGEIPEREIISSESVFVFHSDDERKMVIYGFFLPMMKVSFEDEEITQALKRINFKNIEIKPKHILKKKFLPF